MRSTIKARTPWKRAQNHLFLREVLGGGDEGVTNLSFGYKAILYQHEQKQCITILASRMGVFEFSKVAANVKALFRTTIFHSTCGPP